jgi:hypothetical protein
MSKFLQVTLLFVFLISTAMQCDNGTLQIGQEMDLQVYPNPIPVKHGEASFDLITTLPAIRTLKKIDSLVFELSYQKDGELVTIGSTKMRIPVNWNGIANLHDTAAFELTDFSIPNNTYLNFQMNMFKNGSRKTSELLAISRFVNEEDER